MRLRLAHNRVAIYIAVGVLAALCAFAPTPYSLILPGHAVDLGGVVSLGGLLRPLDILAAIDGKPIASSADLQEALRRVKPGTVVRIGVFRNGGRRIAAVQTTAYRGRTVLGTYLTTIYEGPHLPVSVSFHLPHVAGSSGGLMFALEIYRSLKRQQLPGELRIAGTGTIAYDGSVGPIEGATQKVAAARAAGASLFLVPAENYQEIKDTRGIHVVPVASFNQAIHAVASAAIPQ